MDLAFRKEIKIQKMKDNFGKDIVKDNISNEN